jgi:hypothetical protein
MPWRPLAKTVAEPPLVFALSYDVIRTPVNNPEGEFLYEELDVC